jgi:hypothetical protein
MRGPQSVKPGSIIKTLRYAGFKSDSGIEGVLEASLKLMTNTQVCKFMQFVTGEPCFPAEGLLRDNIRLSL